MSEENKLFKKSEDNNFYKSVDDIQERIDSHDIVFLPPRKNTYKNLTLPLTIHSSIDLYKTTGKIFVSLVKKSEDKKIKTGGIKKKELNTNKAEITNKYSLSFQIERDSKEFKLLTIIHKKSEEHIRNLIDQRINQIKKLMKDYNYNPNVSQNSKALAMINRDLQNIDNDMKNVNFIRKRDLESLHNLRKKKNLLRPLISRWVPENSNEPRYYVHLKVFIDTPPFITKEGKAAKLGDTEFKVFSSFNPLTGKPKYNLIKNLKNDMLSEQITSRIKGFEINRIDFTIGQIQYANPDSQETFLFQKCVAKKVFIHKFLKKTRQYEEGEEITDLANFLDKQEEDVKMLENNKQEDDDESLNFGEDTNKKSKKRKRDENDVDKIEPSNKKTKL
jgi:hypothetical protein